MAGPIQWGTVGEWVSGIGSLTAVVTAVWLARRAEAVSRAARESDQSQSARLAAAKLSIEPDPVSIEDGPHATRWTATVENRSEHPFMDVRATASIEGVPHDAKAWVRGPSLTFPNGPTLSGGVIDLQPPVSIQPASTIYVTAIAHRTDGPARPTWAVTFSDIDRNSWEVTDAGGLRRLP